MKVAFKRAIDYVLKKFPNGLKDPDPQFLELPPERLDDHVNLLASFEDKMFDVLM